MIGQIVSLLGAGMILAAFGAQQAGKWTPDARPYLVLNFLGSAILTWFAVVTLPVLAVITNVGVTGLILMVGMVGAALTLVLSFAPRERG